MSYVLACYKYVLDEEDIVVEDDLRVRYDQAKYKISEYDKNAIAAAVTAAKALDCTAAGLTYAGEAGEKSLKDALSRGLEEAFYVKDEAAEHTDGAATARVLKAAVDKIASTASSTTTPNGESDVKLVICADGSSDVYQRMTAPYLAALLDWPCVTSVNAWELGQDGYVLVTQKTEDDLRTLKVALPCVLAVTPELIAAPVPGMRDILAAGKKPVTRWSVAELSADAAPQVKVVSEQGYAMERKNIMLNEGSSEEKVKQLVAELKKEGVL